MNSSRGRKEEVFVVPRQQKRGSGRKRCVTRQIFPSRASPFPGGEIGGNRGGEGRNNHCCSVSETLPHTAQGTKFYEQSDQIWNKKQ